MNTLYTIVKYLTAGYFSIGAVYGSFVYWNRRYLPVRDQRLNPEERNELLGSYLLGSCVQGAFWPIGLITLLIWPKTILHPYRYAEWPSGVSFERRQRGCSTAPRNAPFIN